MNQTLKTLDTNGNKTLLEIIFNAALTITTIHRSKNKTRPHAHSTIYQSLSENRAITLRKKVHTTTTTAPRTVVKPPPWRAQKRLVLPLDQQRRATKAATAAAAVARFFLFTGATVEGYLHVRTYIYTTVALAFLWLIRARGAERKLPATLQVCYHFFFLSLSLDRLFFFTKRCNAREILE